jgi:hypothetical protein
MDNTEKEIADALLGIIKTTTHPNSTAQERHDAIHNYEAFMRAVSMRANLPPKFN